MLSDVIAMGGHLEVDGELVILIVSGAASSSQRGRNKRGCDAKAQRTRTDTQCVHPCVCHML